MFICKTIVRSRRLWIRKNRSVDGVVPAVYKAVYKENRDFSAFLKPILAYIGRTPDRTVTKPLSLNSAWKSAYFGI